MVPYPRGLVGGNGKGSCFIISMKMIQILQRQHKSKAGEIKEVGEGPQLTITRVQLKLAALDRKYLRAIGDTPTSESHSMVS